MVDINKYTEELIQKLQSTKANERYEACVRLRGLPVLSPEAIRRLREARGDPDPSVARAAKRALEKSATNITNLETRGSMAEQLSVKCPQCGAPEQSYLSLCEVCGKAYTSEDLVELHQLEYLLAETATWPQVEPQRKTYSEKLEALKARMNIIPALVAAQAKHTEEPAALDEVLSQPITSATVKTIPEVVTHPSAMASARVEKQITTRPPRESVPFDQWLLSDRNIKIALYSGGVLLVLAGLIFVGVNWARIAGPVKFAITLLITGLMYLGGYLLFRRPALKLGGVALLSVGSGFIPLNFVVLQVYIFAERGLSANMMWFLGSFPTLLLYLLTAYLTRTSLFTYFSTIALGSALTAGLVILDMPLLVFPLTFAVLMIIFLFGSKTLQSTRLAGFLHAPLLIIAHVLTPIIVFSSILLWLLQFGFRIYPYGNLWLAPGIMMTSVIFYIATDIVFHWKIARWVSVGLFIFTLLIFLIQAEMPTTWIGFSMMILFLAYLLIGYFIENQLHKRQDAMPLLIIAHMAIPLGFMTSIGFWIGTIGCHSCISGGPWPALAGMLIGVAFYIASDLQLHWRFTRWVTAFIFAVTCLCLMVELNLSDTLIGVSLMILALAYLLVGKILELHSVTRDEIWPLFAAGYTLALLVTLRVLISVGENPDDLAKILIADVALLALSAWVHRKYGWVYGATWFFIAPVYIYSVIYLPDLYTRGMVLGVLMLTYAVAGYVLGRRSLRLGGSFLIPMVLLSLITIGLTWENAIVVSLTLMVVACLYFFFAIWRGWNWLLLPSLLAVDLLTAMILRLFNIQNLSRIGMHAIAYAILAVVMTLGGAWLRYKGHPKWGWPLYLVGGLNILGSYITGFFERGWIAISLSIVFACLTLWLTWRERETFSAAKIPPILSYFGVGLLFVGHLFVLDIALDQWENWFAYTVILCALFMVISWGLRRESVRNVYGTPIQQAGGSLMIVPFIGVLSAYEPILGIVTFGIIGITLAVDAGIRQNRWLAYLAGGAFIAVIWSLLFHFDITELQAYVIPLGLGLLVLGWNERRHEIRMLYLLATILGLLTLMSIAFIQSLDDVIYAVLLLVESLLAFGWGIRIHSRSFVELGVLSLLINAITQFGPGFVELPRWIQLGVIGIILLGGGLAALFRREQLLITRKRMADEWRKWQQ